MQQLRRILFGGLTAVILAGCGGSSGSGGTPPPAPPPPGISEAEAVRFLRQASFGPTEQDVAAVIAMGYADWIDAQIATPATSQVAILNRLGTVDDEDGHNDRVEAWLESALIGPDQLRQRVAFALSEIMVVSQQSGLFAQPYGTANYYDLLLTSAFGNFRQLMEDVTLSPAMGVYLSMLGNQKPNPAFNIRPDENYARELMQLFTIGLVELNQDGTVRRDAQNQPLPTYDQDIIEGFAHVFTGWTFGGSPSFIQPSFDYLQPMQAFPFWHDTGAKQVLNNETIPAGQTPEQDLTAALDNIFAHPNVAPFISKQLIQKLVTSNPSPAYVQRVATVFDDNGTGVKGDLAAVVKAILLDDEARSQADSEEDGKVVEPVIRLIALWRAFDATARDGRFDFPLLGIVTGQGPLQARSVFNFFQPGYAPPGEIKDQGLVAPEMEIVDELQVAFRYNVFTLAIIFWNSEVLSPLLEEYAIDIDVGDEIAVASDVPALIDTVADKLLGGAISAELRAEATTMANLHPDTQPAQRALEVIHTIANSPEFTTLR
ncbi:MAG: DUF1800 domain-containing protein [Gammaproteobacteria bacterium]|nr:DUF1800 domain-containing protein [Gammaproteobacteria bacterium]